MRHPEVTLAHKVRILELLGRCETADQVGARLDLSAREVIDIAANHGYPDPEKMTAAAAMIASRVARPSPEPAAPAVLRGDLRSAGQHVVDLDTAGDGQDSKVGGYHYGGVVEPTPKTPPRAHPMPERTLQAVQVDELFPDPDNPRETLADIEALADSMASVGLITPIIARRDGDRLVIVAGHRRHAAAKLLGWQSVDVIVRKDMPADDVLLAMIAENGQRTDLDPIEEARAYRTLMTRLGVSARKVAAQSGRTEVYVSGRLAMLDLPVGEQELIRAGQMNIGDGIRMARAARHGHVASWTTRGHNHLGVAHPLAAAARAECAHLAHKAQGLPQIGGGACGVCWESVIRADERNLAPAVRRDAS